MRAKSLLTVSLLCVAILACNLPSQAVTPTMGLSPLFTQTPFFIPPQQTSTSTLLIPITGQTATPTVPAVVASPTVPTVSVSVNTNCRTGPGLAYDRIGGLLVGETASVVGKYTPGNYWIINNPDASGTCWLWGQYAAVIGNTAGLPEHTPPPTPTASITPSPTITLTPSLPAAPTNMNYTATCAAPPNVIFFGATLFWEDNSNNEDGFRIYRSGILLATLGPNAESYAVTATGDYSVETFNGAGASSRVETTVACP